MAGGNGKEKEKEKEKGKGRRFFVAVHVGAGYHAPSNDKPLRSAMKRACLAAAQLLSTVAYMPFTFFNSPRNYFEKKI